MIGTIVVCGFVLILGAIIYFMLRNEWVANVRMEIIDEIYEHNIKLIYEDLDETTYQDRCKAFDMYPSYDYMLYRKIFVWDKEYFKQLCNKERIG